MVDLRLNVPIVGAERGISLNVPQLDRSAGGTTSVPVKLHATARTAVKLQQ